MPLPQQGELKLFLLPWGSSEELRVQRGRGLGPPVELPGSAHTLLLTLCPQVHLGPWNSGPGLFCFMWTPSSGPGAALSHYVTLSESPLQASVSSTSEQT